MLTLAYPWLLLLLPLLWVLRWVVPAYRESQEALRVPFLGHLVALTGDTASSGAAVARVSRVQRLVIMSCWALFVLAVARPQWIGEPVSRTVPTRDLLLAVDLSGSMETRDFTNQAGDSVDRLTAVKEVLDEFLTRREGDRVGLVFFGTAPFLQVPFTEDLEVCRLLLDEAQVRMAGPKTAMGDAIGLGIQLFRNSEVEKRVLMILTDGNDTASQVPPENAARLARDEGIRIYTIAAGDPAAAGEQALDEAVLKAVAETTGGTYYHAEDREALQGVYAELDALETREVETLSHRPRHDLFYVPLAAGLLLNMVFHALQAVLFAVRSRRAGHTSAPVIPDGEHA